ncbi:MAG: GNAT family N-acetyltransferase [Thermoplasmata archaeon]|nr:GNAT family N-acetyltransferase [Thermoplasmata archaeon]
MTLPNLWILGGIFTRRNHRGKGWGRAITTTATRAAIFEGARPALAVRADNISALRVYQRLGYETVEHRVWVDAGASLAP